MGLSYIDDPPETLRDTVNVYFWLLLSSSALLCLVVTEYAYVTNLLINTSSVAEFVACFHIVGYGSMSVGKMITLYYKKNTFKKLVKELADIWPVSIDNEQTHEIKRKSLASLKFNQKCYAFFNVFGLIMYDVTPLVLCIYRKIQGAEADLGYIWHSLYPFDKTKPVYHEIVYIFEAYAGVASVCSMIGSDLLFSAMASHICMLLRILQVKIRNLEVLKSENRSINSENEAMYQDLASIIKLHQRLIKYGDDLEDAFSAANFINVILSSINICCVMFNIVLLEPWMEMSNKLFLGAALSQIGMLCWYADDIYRASVSVGDAAYESQWYNADNRRRRALLILIQRSQKPLYFTALKFSRITMATYNRILTTSYSYFALLYTIYNNN